MSTAIIGRSEFAAGLRSVFSEEGLDISLLAPDKKQVGDYNLLLMADEPYFFPGQVQELCPNLRPGQAILVGSGGAFATWTVSKTLYHHHAPDRIIVGMTDAWNGDPDCSRIFTGTAAVSAHNFVYTQLLCYWAGEIFDDPIPAGSPLAISLADPAMVNLLSPIAESGKISPHAYEEALGIGEKLGTERRSDIAHFAADKGSDLEHALHHAAVTLYPLCRMADHVGYDAPELKALLRRADELTDGKVSAEGTVHMPKPELFFEHEHK